MNRVALCITSLIGMLLPCACARLDNGEGDGDLLNLLSGNIAEVQPASDEFSTNQDEDRASVQDRDPLTAGLVSARTVNQGSQPVEVVMRFLLEGRLVHETVIPVAANRASLTVGPELADTVEFRGSREDGTVLLTEVFLINVNFDSGDVLEYFVVDPVDPNAGEETSDESEQQEPSQEEDIIVNGGGGADPVEPDPEEEEPPGGDRGNGGCNAAAPPADVDAVGDCGAVVIDWQVSPGASEYEVWRNTVDASSTAELIATTTETFFEDVEAEAGATYWYWIKAINVCGASDFGTPDDATPALAPQIAQSPQSQSVCQGEMVIFHVEAGGTEPLRYQWRLNGVEIPGATEATLTIDAVNPEDAGDYDVVVGNDCGQSISTPATLTVLAGPAILEQPENTSACEGGTALFNVAAGGAAPLRYQWRKDGIGLEGETGTELLIKSALPEDAGVYDVMVTNECDEVVSMEATLTVGEPGTADLDLDCDVDLTDFSIFQGCLTGPDGAVEPGCEDADFDGDGDVDLLDFGVLQKFFSGS